MTKNELTPKANALRFDLMVSIRYNSKRARFFKRWNDMNSFLAVLFGSSVVVSLLSEYVKAGLILSGMITALSLLALVMDFSGKAVSFQTYVQTYTALVNRLISADSLDELNAIEAEINILDAQEGEPLATLYDICYNEQLQVEKLPTEPIKISTCRRLLAHYV